MPASGHRYSIGASALLWALATTAVGRAAEPAAQPLTLATCVASALAANPQLVAARENARAAGANSWSAWSGYLPSIGGDASETRATSNPHYGETTTLLPSGTAVTFPTTNRVKDNGASTSYLAGITARQAILDVSRFAAIQQARASDREAAELLRQTRQAVHFAAVQAFYNCLRAQRLLAVQDGAFKQLQEHARSAHAFVDVGSRPRMDAVQADANLANAKVALIRARNALRVARLSLTLAMGSNEDLAWDPSDPFETPRIPESTGDLHTAALLHRADILAAVARLDQARSGVWNARSEFLPTVSASAGYRWSGADFPLPWNWQIGASASWSFFSSGGSLARARAADARVDGAAAVVESAKQTARTEVEQAWSSLGEAQERTEATQAAVAQAALALELADARYRTGAGSPLELTDARSVKLTADTNRVEALCDRAIAASGLDKATGMLGEGEPRPLEVK